MELWTPEREWDGQDAILIGGGPSLSTFDFKQLEGRNVIGCNDAFHLGPQIIKFAIFGDPSWWHKNKWALEEHKGRIVTNAPGVIRFNLPYIHLMNRERDGIHSGSTLGWNYSTGAAAINLAVSLGAANIYLLGYDLTNATNQSHWHNYNGKMTQEYAFQRFMGGFARLKEDLPQGTEVFNVTDGTSRLQCFKRIDLKDFLRFLTLKHSEIDVLPTIDESEVE